MRRSLAAFLLAGVTPCALAAGTSDPAALTPPAGATLIGRYAAKGEQIYRCVTKGPSTVWTLEAPEATLAGPDGKPLIHHYVGPTWEATDGSKVVGTLMVKVPAPDAKAIPWLLLSGKAAGAGLLAGTRFVQRLDTAGGGAPAGACAAGTEQRSPYTATYAFWR